VALAAPRRERRLTRRGVEARATLCAVIAAVAIASNVPAAARVEVVVPLVLLAHLAWAAAIGSRPRRATVLWLTIFLVILCALARPVAEDDYWRFLWDAHRTLADGTPYGRAPAEWFGDPSLPPSVQAVLDGINHPDVPTIYGPALQFLFLAAHLLAAIDPWGLSLLFGALHLGGTILALRFIPAHRVALAAWNPLLLQQCLMNLHPDFLLGWLLLAAAIAARRGFAARTGALLAVAIATKVSALVALPVLGVAMMRRRGAGRAAMARAVAVSLATLSVFYLPWLTTAASEGAGLATFAQTWRFNPALFAPLADLFGDAAARAIAAGVVGLAVLGLAAKATPKRSFGSVVLAIAVLLALSPVINAWYLAWLLPCATLTRWRAPWVAAAVLSLSTLTVGELGLAGDPFALPGSVVALQWVLIGAALIADFPARRHRHPVRDAAATGESLDAMRRSEHSSRRGPDRGAMKANCEPSRRDVSRTPRPRDDP
jgi:hypothetical protein